MDKNIKSLADWLAWLEASHPIANIELGLERIHQVAEFMGLLKFDCPVIIVAGTNGKGSTIAALESLSQAHNLNIGSYTSPHLIKFNERIKINGLSLEDDVISRSFDTVFSAKSELEKQLSKQIDLTYFEFTTLVGLNLFKQTKLDLIALEVGLGGRFDAVNIVDPDVAIITSIGLDHTDWLGDDLAAIAYEKSGIMRKDVTAILANADLEDLCQKAISEIGPKTLVAGKDFQYLSVSDENYWTYSYKNLSLKISESGLYISNLAAAMTAFASVIGDVEAAKSEQALASAQLLGRFQKLQSDDKSTNTIWLDVAHNPDSAALLNEKLLKEKARIQSTAPKSSEKPKIWAICGMLQDKDITTSLSCMNAVDRWLLVDLPKPRGAQAALLADVLNEAMDRQQLPLAIIKNCGSLDLAVENFKNNASEHDSLIVFGSFVTVGQMLEYWQSN